MQLMRTGDVVKFIGYPRYQPTREYGMIGVIVKVHRYYPASYNVLWSNGQIGKQLWGEVLEVISES